MAKRRRPRMVEEFGLADPALFEFPGVQIRVERALATLRPGAEVETCGHPLGYQIAGAWMCAQHPGRILCHRCLRRHVADHDDQTEYSCDACDQILPDGVVSSLGVVLPVNLEGRLVPVGIQGIGLCRRCRGVEVA